ncbi:MAG: pilus assembly protein TadG-related protein [Actinomycetes bacterium]
MTNARHRFARSQPDNGRKRPHSERGAVAVLVGLMMFALLVMAALVLDIGYARVRVSGTQSAVDLAALAAGPQLGADKPTTACEDALKNLATNVSDLASVNSSTFCSGMGTTVCSGAGGQAKPQTTAGGTTLQITYPALDSDITAKSATTPWVNDGTACRRMKISITSSATTTFGKIVGITSLPITRSATVLGRAVTTGDVPALWLLDPTGCTPLNVTGGSQLTAGKDAPDAAPGLIAIDSDGSACSSNQTTISASGTGSFLKAVPQSGTDLGKISLFGLSATASTCAAPACSATDVSAGRVSPQPVSQSSRATRAPVDWKYNCKTTYPNYRGIAIEGCSSGTPPYVDNLKAAIGTSGQPAGFQKWTSTYSCNAASATVSGNWWIDCNTLTIGNGTNLVFNGGNIVMDGSLKMTGGTFTVNTANPAASMSSPCLPTTVVTPCTTSSSAKAAFIYQRAGDIDITGGVLNLQKTAVIQVNGYLLVNSSPPTWIAPTEGPFSGLSFWSEASSNKYQMAGGAGVLLSGVFFTPNADPFSLSGGGTWGQQSAQFISFRLSVSGGGTATLVPDLNLVGLRSTKPGLLIR